MADELFDVSEVRRFEHDLARVPGRIVPLVDATVRRGAFNIRKDWRSRWKGLSHLPRVAASINYDIRHTTSTIEAEIGADRNRPQGNLAHIAENGTIKNPPHPGGAPALKVEAPKFVKALGEAAAKAIKP